MKKTIKLTESDLTKMVKRIINEDTKSPYSNMSDEELMKLLTDVRNEFSRREKFMGKKERDSWVGEGFSNNYREFNGNNMGFNSFPKELLKYSDTILDIRLSNNNIKEIPEWITEFKNLQSLLLKGNPITHIPNSITELDPENGGSLNLLVLDNKPLKLQKLLPSVIVR